VIGAITAGLYAGGVPPVTNSYESIATVTVGSGGASSASFSSIPSTFKHDKLLAPFVTPFVSSYFMSWFENSK